MYQHCNIISLCDALSVEVTSCTGAGMTITVTIDPVTQRDGLIGYYLKDCPDVILGTAVGNVVTVVLSIADMKNDYCGKYVSKENFCWKIVKTSFNKLSVFYQVLQYSSVHNHNADFKFQNYIYMS